MPFSMTGPVPMYDSRPITLAPIGPKPKKKRKPRTLSPEAHERLVNRCLSFNTDPEMKARRLEGLRKALEKKRADPEYRKRERAWLDAARSKSIRMSRAFNAEHFADPEVRKWHGEQAKQRWEDPELRERMAAKRGPQSPRLIALKKRVHDRRRGFKVPERLWPEYQRLIRSKKLKAREAGRILGLI